MEKSQRCYKLSRDIYKVIEINSTLYPSHLYLQPTVPLGSVPSFQLPFNIFLRMCLTHQE